MQYKTREKNNQNKTISRISRPATALSFGGSLNSVVSSAYENEAAYNAILSLIVAGILKPAAVLNMPGSEEKDKQMVATKNFLQAFIGFFLTATVGGEVVKKAYDNIDNNIKLLSYDKTSNNFKTIDANSIKAYNVARNVLVKEHNTLGNKLKAASENFSNSKGLNKITSFVSTLSKKLKYEPTPKEIVDKSADLIEQLNKEHLKFYNKNPDFVRMIKEKAQSINGKELKSSVDEAYTSVVKNSTGAITAIGKAIIASMLLPTVLKAIFGKRNEQKKKESQRANLNILETNAQFQNERSVFKAFNKKSGQVAFKGSIVNSMLSGLTKGAEKISMSKPAESFITGMSKLSKKPSARMADLESLMLTSYWLISTTKSKKIEPSQKLGLNIHTALVTAVSSACAFIIDWAFDSSIENGKEKYKETLRKIVQNEDVKKALEEARKDKVEITSSFKNLPLIEYFIKDKCNSIISENKSIEEAIPNIIKQLKAAGLFSEDELKQKDFQGELKNVINNTYITYAPTKGLQKTILECIDKNYKGLFEETNVAKELSNALLGEEKEVNKAIESLAKSYGKKFSKFKSLTIFALVVRFLVPVALVPVSGKLKKLLINKTSGKQKQKA